MNWDPFQREVLAELGHVVYRQAGVALESNTQAAHIEAPHGDVVWTDGEMLAHVARAAGMTAEVMQACFGDVHVIASLRGNAAAKRALWPRLRALRKQHNG